MRCELVAFFRVWAQQAAAKIFERICRVCVHFYTGLAALQVGDDVRAENKLGQATQIAPGEPAGWADWGILALRQRNFDVAAQRLGTARDLAPKNDHIYYLLGLLESNRGRSAEAIADWRKSVELNPQNLRATYQLAEEIERQGDVGGAAEFQKLVEKILAVQPDNLAALLELSRIAAKRGDAATLRATVDRIEKQSAGWAPEAKQQLTGVASGCRWTGHSSGGNAHRVFAKCIDARFELPAKPGCH